LKIKIPCKSGDFYFCLIMMQELFTYFIQHPVVTTDSRNITPGCIFFALKGENFNGNDFLSKALEEGAGLVIGDEDRGIQDARCMIVKNALEALQELAKMYRLTWKFPVVGITGSNGKTTTKELVRDVLATRYKVHATKGNLNNHIGIPLTILSAPQDTDMAIIEMGANHQKEIASYCLYAIPTHGLITNIGKAHLEGFGGQEGVKKGKKELYDYLNKSQGEIFVNLELPWMKEITDGMKVNAFGQHFKIEVKDKVNGMDLLLKTTDKEIEFTSYLKMGEYSAQEHGRVVELINALGLSAILVGKEFEMWKNDHLFFQTVEELVAWLQSNPITKKTILIKGSRGIQLERVIPCL
jgi:UDP-N-acetylmuramyl pentapeptide synthase